MPDSAPSPFPAAAHQGVGFRIEALPAGHVLQALARKFAADLSGPLATIAESKPFAVRRAGPDVWLIVGDVELSAKEIAQRGAEIAEHAWLVDQSDGLCRLGISGPQSVPRLARGIGADLTLRGFRVGAAQATQYDTISLHVTRMATDRFELLVGRSFAESLWRELAE